MVWLFIKRTVDVLTLMLLIIMISIVVTNSKSAEDFGSFGLKLDQFRQESLTVMSKNIDYFDTRTNKLAEVQDRYQVSMDQRVYVIENQVKLLQADKKQNQRIINNNQSNAVIYQNTDPIQK